MLYCIVRYWIGLDWIGLYRIVLVCTELYCVVLDWIVLYCIVLYCIVSLHYFAIDLMLSESKVQTTIQALQCTLKTDGYSLNVFKDDSIKLARAAVRGDPRAKHAQRTRKRRLPVTFDMLFYLEDLLLQSRHIDDWMTYLGVLMAFHFMLRVSEYCLDGSSHMPFVVVMSCF